MISLRVPRIRDLLVRPKPNLLDSVSFYFVNDSNLLIFAADLQFEAAEPDDPANRLPEFSSPEESG